MKDEGKKTDNDNQDDNTGRDLFLLSMVLFVLGFTMDIAWFDSLYTVGIGIVLLFLSVVVGGFGVNQINGIITFFSKIKSTLTNRH